MSLTSELSNLASRLATEFNSVRQEIADNNASIATSETPPADSDIWFNSSNGEIYVKYEDAWVGVGGPTGPVGPSGIVSTNNTLINSGSASEANLGINLNNPNTWAGQQRFNGGVLNPNQIFFWIGNSADQQITYPVGSLVDFNSPKYNRGNGYSTATNRFTAPTSGVYLLWFNAFNASTTASNRRVSFYLNSARVAGQSSVIGGASSFSQSVCIYLNQSDFVDVRAHGEAPTTLYSFHAHTEFGGYLLG